MAGKKLITEAGFGGLASPSAPTSGATAPAFLFDEVCAKSATAAADGWLDHHLELGGDAQPTRTWEIVEVHRGAPATRPTSSGFREFVLEAWWQPVVGAPVA